MKIILFSLLGLLALALLLVAAFFFAFPATQVVHADIIIGLSDEKGQALANQEVEIWEYDHYTQTARSNEKGIVEFKNQSFMISKIMLQFWKKRPEVFSIRLRMPQINKLYYRFEVENFGSVPYEVFSDSYDYFFGEKWLGSFNDKTQTRHQVKDMGKIYSAVEPPNECKCVPLWNAKANISPVGENNFVIQLNLEQSGIWKFSGN